MTSAPRLTLAPRVAPSSLQPKAGPEIAFERVLLELTNRGPAPATGLRLELTAHQGADGICEVDEALAGELAPGAGRTWDLYDLLLEKGHGFPSKVHLFGVKAAIGWDFTVRAAVEHAKASFRVRWSGDPAGPITASVEAVR